MRKTILLLALSSAFSAFSQEFEFSEIMREEAEDQVGGVCHVYAAVALAEAVCFQKTGVHLNLSESHLVYLHLRSKILGMEHYPLSKQEESIGYISSLDAGYVEDSLPRILAGQAVLEEEFPRGERFTSKAYWFVRTEQEAFEKTKEKTSRFARVLTPFGRNTKAVTERMQNRKARNVDEDFPQKFAEYMDELVLYSRPDATPIKGKGYLIQSRSAAYRQCVAPGLIYRKQPYSDELADQLLEARQPFICSGSRQFGEKWHPHAGVILGKRTSDKGLEFYGRNHDSEKPFEWIQPKCESIFYVQERSGQQ